MCFIKHFELFGLRQVVSKLAGRPAGAGCFRSPLLGKLARHPIYLGFIIAFWAAPTMTAGHLLFAAMTTAYIFVTILLEDRELVDMSGQDRRYSDRVSILVPRRKSA
jgi:protein-S-isoprenylcysteine O-methyltransferase Ste14